MPKPALVFPAKEPGVFLCVYKSIDGGLDFFAQESLVGGALIPLPLKEVRALSTYLLEHLYVVDGKISPPK